MASEPGPENPEAEQDPVPIVVSESRVKKADAQSSSRLSGRTDEEADEDDGRTGEEGKSEESGSLEGASELDGLMETLSKIAVQAPHNTPRQETLIYYGEREEAVAGALNKIECTS